MDPSFIRSLVQTTADNVENVIIGKRLEVELVMTALLCRGHVLIEDVPGVGKTVLTKAIARSIGSSFRRIQFTPDLLPGDITGVNIFNQQRGAFEFRPGPIVSQMVLADEINRATPKTQSALLEAMEEAQITIDGATHLLPQPFLVLATENPIDYEGTFPLPEAQLDRFLMRIGLGYPGKQNELEMLDRQHQRHPLETLKQVASINDLKSAQEAVRQIHVAPSIREYIVAIVEATRNHDEVFLGASPRGSIALFNATRAWAAIRGRNFVLPDDVKFLATPTLAHRIIVSPSARMHGYDSRNVVADLLRQLPVPQTSTSPAAV
ncbi:MAG: MoxR family ATPase [Thermomicrobiales bacterium]|nr:MoxR family ATPase [Thermomicrobiales bacterium]